MQLITKPGVFSTMRDAYYQAQREDKTRECFLLNEVEWGQLVASHNIHTCLTRHVGYSVNPGDSFHAFATRAFRVKPGQHHRVPNGDHVMCPEVARFMGVPVFIVPEYAIAA